MKIQIILLTAFISSVRCGRGAGCSNVKLEIANIINFYQPQIEPLKNTVVTGIQNLIDGASLFTARQFESTFTSILNSNLRAISDQENTISNDVIRYLHLRIGSLLEFDPSDAKFPSSCVVDEIENYFDFLQQVHSDIKDITNAANAVLQEFTGFLPNEDCDTIKQDIANFIDSAQSNINALQNTVVEIFQNLISSANTISAQEFGDTITIVADAYPQVFSSIANDVSSSVINYLNLKITSLSEFDPSDAKFPSSCVVDEIENFLDFLQQVNSDKFIEAKTNDAIEFLQQHSTLIKSECEKNRKVQSCRSLPKCSPGYSLTVSSDGCCCSRAV
jgi:ElaB/YqjD/DUF883 family membrane-anchored ribosome-binding protein